MIVDTHIHVWNFEKAHYSWLDGDRSILNRTYNTDEIDAERKNLGITTGVLVQAANNLEDTHWMLQLADETGWLKGVVGWLPLMDPSSTQDLLENKFLKNKYFKGVRHLIHDEVNAEWLLQPAVLESLEILADHKIPYDVVGVLPAHISTVLKIAEKIPHLEMVFDHLNHPRMDGEDIYRQWKSLMISAAGHKNFYAKISGLGTVADKAGWTEDDVKPAISFALETFGADRCFCGGDWPVSLLGGSYTKTWTAYKNIITALLSKDEREKVFSKNALKFYKI